MRPVPSWLAGPFGSTGIGLGNGGLILVLVVMFGSYVLAVHAADRLSARTVLMCIAAIHALVLLAPPLLSTDVFSYQFYGRMGALYGANPYLAGPHALALDPLFPYIGAKWVNTPTVYGPLFTALSYVLAPLSIAASALAYKAIAALREPRRPSRWCGMPRGFEGSIRSRRRRSSDSTRWSSSTGWAAATTTC